MIVYGALFAVLTAIIFTVLGCFSAQLSGWVARRPKAVATANVGAGLAIIGLADLVPRRRRPIWLERWPSETQPLLASDFDSIRSHMSRSSSPHVAGIAFALLTTQVRQR